MVESTDYFGLLMNLALGPHEGDGEWTPEQLERAWSVYRGQVEIPRRPGHRCWGYWRFELGEEPPEDEPAQALRLLDLGELVGGELQAVRERALGALRYIARTDHLEAIGAIVTTPRSAASRGRVQRAADAERWRAVLDAVGDA